MDKQCGQYVQDDDVRRRMRQDHTSRTILLHFSLPNLSVLRVRYYVRFSVVVRNSSQPFLIAPLVISQGQRSHEEERQEKHR